MRRGHEVGAWDGVGSELVAGALSGAVVFGGIKWTQHLGDKSENKRRRYEAAALLVQEISNLSDRATRSGGRLKGDFALWPLRNRLMMSRYLFSNDKPLEKIEEFVRDLDSYRTWLRHDMGGPELEVARDQALEVADEYQRLVRIHAEALIEMLQSAMGSIDLLRTARPKYPVLPWCSAPPDDA